MAAKWKEPPRDALDTLTLSAVDLRSLNSIDQLDYMPFDPVLKRTEGIFSSFHFLNSDTRIIHFLTTHHISPSSHFPFLSCYSLFHFRCFFFISDAICLL